MTAPLHPLTFWRAALRRWLGLLPRTGQTAPACGLGLDGLPQGLGQLPVGTPVALAWQGPSASQPVSQLWAQALVQDLLQHGPALLLAEDAHSANRLLQHPALAQALRQGRLLVWLMRPDLALGLRPEGMAPVFAELRRAGLTRAHALLVLASPRTHLGASVAQTQQWGQQIALWCRGRTRPVVFAFQAWQHAEQVLTPLLPLAEAFQHVALLGSEAAQPMLFVERWNGSDGPQYAVRLGLQRDAGGERLAYDGSQMQGQRQRLVEAPDHYAVIATQAALAGQRGVPADWTVLAPDADVLAASHHAIAATVLLHSGPASQLENLLQQVYQLRQQHGRALKIVVRETQDKLRSNLEQALLYLGANSVVYREVGFARLQRLLDDLREVSFTRDLPPDYAVARAGFMPDALRGYLPVDAFCNTVEAMLARTRHMGLAHSFLRLSMRPQVAHLDAVRACVALRDGDVLTADHNALYVFMFACAEADIDPALARLFALPPEALFTEQTLYPVDGAVRDALLALREAARKGVPDYSAYRSANTRADGERATPNPALAPSSVVISATPSSADQATPSELALAHWQALPLHTSVDTAPLAPAAPPAPTVHARPLLRRGAQALVPAQAQPPGAATTQGVFHAD